MKTSFESSNEVKEISLFKDNEILKNQYLFFNCLIISSKEIDSLIKNAKITEIGKSSNIEIYYTPNYLYDINKNNKIFEKINAQKDKRYYYLKEHMFFYKFLLNCLQLKSKEKNNNIEKEIFNLDNINEICYRTLINRLYLLYDNPDSNNVNYGKIDIFGVPCIYSITEPDIIDQIINMKKLSFGLMNMNEDKVSKLFGITDDIENQSCFYNKILISISEGNSTIKEEGSIKYNKYDDPDNRNKSRIEVEKNLINLSSELFLFHYITKQFEKNKLIQIPKMIFFCCLYDKNCKDIYQIKLDKMNKAKNIIINTNEKFSSIITREQLEDKKNKIKENKNEIVKENSLIDEKEKKIIKNIVNPKKKNEFKEKTIEKKNNNSKVTTKIERKNLHIIKTKKKIPINDIIKEKSQDKLNKKNQKIQKNKEGGKYFLKDKETDKNGRLKSKNKQQKIISKKSTIKENQRVQRERDSKNEEQNTIKNKDNIKEDIFSKVKKKTKENTQKKEDENKEEKKDINTKETCQKIKIDKNIIKCDLMKFCGTLELDGAFKYKGEEKKLDTKSLAIILSGSLNCENNNIKKYIEKYEAEFIIDMLNKFYDDQKYLTKIFKDNVIYKNIELENKSFDAIINEYKVIVERYIIYDKNIIVKTNDLILIKNKKEYNKHIANELQNFIMHSLFFICLYKKLNLLENISTVHLLFIYDHYKNYNDERHTLIEIYKIIKENSERLGTFKNNIKFYLIHSLPNLSVTIFDKLDNNIKEQNIKINNLTNKNLELNNIVEELKIQIENLKNEIDTIKKSNNFLNSKISKIDKEKALRQRKFKQSNNN